MNAGPLPQPGWYHDGRGLRWWDGRAWGPYAPPRDPFLDGRTLAILSHLGFFFGSFVVALVIRLTEGQKNAYVRHHATEALNFAITFGIGWIAGYVGFFATAFGLQGRYPALFALPFALLAVVFFGGAACAVLGAVRASQGKAWRYPVSIRLVRGALPRDEA